MIELPKEIIDNRKNVFFFFARTANILGFHVLGKSHIEIHENFHDLKKKDAVYIYTGLHKSLWETTGILVALHKNGHFIPYAGMGDNLVRGKSFQSIAKKIGVFLIKRPTNRREILESAKKLKQYMITFMAYGKDVLFFPEGTRKSILSEGKYGKFFPTAFEAVLEYERDKEKLLEHYSELTPHNVYVVPTNVDYSRVREDREMLATYQGKPRTLKVYDSLRMFQNIGHTYVSFGEPIKVSDHLDKSRKELAVFTREKCLELVKILPINIVSRAVLDSITGDTIDKSAIETNISKNIKKLSHLQDRFRGFSKDDVPADILKKVTKYERVFRPEHLDIQHRSFYKLYADYVGHYY